MPYRTLSSSCTPAQALMTRSHTSEYLWTTTRSLSSPPLSTSTNAPSLQPTTFCAAACIACVPPLTRFSRSYVGFTVGKGQNAGPIILENVSFAPSGSVMTLMTLVIFCVFSVLISFLQGNQVLRARFVCVRLAPQRQPHAAPGSLSFWRNKASLRKEQYLSVPLRANRIISQQ